MSLLIKTFRGALAVSLILAATACGGDDNDNKPIDGAIVPPIDAPGEVQFHQVEHLARPGINEALLITNDFNAGYNATAPSFTGVPAATLGQVVGEAKTVLKAIYLGTCLINGVAGLNAQNGAHPAGLECTVVGGAVFEADGVTISAAAATGAQAYADKVFDQFIPDVMRIDTSVTVSSYLTLCGTPADKPLLCGGRFLSDDTIDVTYDYLIAGAAISRTAPAGALGDQFRALTSDGVNFSPTPGDGASTVSTPDPSNPNQFHPAVTNTFPYSAAPF